MKYVVIVLSLLLAVLYGFCALFGLALPHPLVIRIMVIMFFLACASFHTIRGVGFIDKPVVVNPMLSGIRVICGLFSLAVLSELDLSDKTGSAFALIFIANGLWLLYDSYKDYYKK